MIERFKENRLIKLLVIAVAIISIIYITAALCLLFIPPDNETQLYLLPTIDTAAFTEGSV